MQHLVRNTVIILIVMVAMVLAAYPPEKKLRLGKDLQGGTSLVYSVQIDPGEDPTSVMGRTIAVLKRRVDPDGLFEITMTAQGRDRLEITMPLPTDRVKQLRAELDARIDGLGKDAVTSDALERIVRLHGDEREKAIVEASRGNAARADVLRAACAAADKAAESRTEYERAAAAGAPQEAQDLMLSLAGEAEAAYETAREAVLSGVLRGEDVRRALELRDVRRRIVDRATGQVEELPSPRARALDRLREEYPGQAAEIDEIVAMHAAYTAERRTLDDPEDLVRLLQGAGVLTFRIAVDPGQHPEEERLRRELREVGPRNVRVSDAGWYKINQIETWYDDVQGLRALLADAAGYFRNRGYVVEEHDGEYYMLNWDTPTTRLTPAEGSDWACIGASQTQDDIGRPAILFRMNPRGGVLLGNLTSQHVSDQMSVLLDDEVYTSPNLLNAISNQGTITGEFSQAEIDYIVQVLSAGSLQAKLSPRPISVSTIGPDLGRDNLDQGLRAGYLSLIVISVFMIVYYYVYGFVAVIALLCTGLIILGAMALNRAAFSLPGIAGVVLTFGMAVDANVLIYERIREELRKGMDLRSSIRAGYKKAMSSIVDGNLTNLIVCIVLANVGTQEIRGFAITLGIGVVATMFAGIFVTRVVFTYLTEIFGLRKLSMLPYQFNIVERVLTPNIRWMRLRWVFVIVSSVYVGLGVFMIISRGSDILDNQFRGGTQVVLRFKEDAAGVPVTLTRQEVQDRVRAIAEQDTLGNLRDLRSTSVLPINPRSDGVTSDTFRIQTLATDGESVSDALQKKFDDVLDVRPPVRFAGDDAPTAREGPVFPVLSGRLGEDINEPEYRNDVSDFIGGVAIVLADMDPRPSVEGIEARLHALRAQPDFSDTVSREQRIIVLEGTEREVSKAVVLVNDPAAGFFASEGAWATSVRDREWDVVRTAMSRTTALAELQSFSPQIAETFKARAFAAVVISLLLILIYIWVRFGSLRYSLGAVVCLGHDVLTAIGFIALAEILYDHSTTEGIARSLGILPFKIDLNIVAALLTIIGYSLNDSIIVMDRIRENRGKQTHTTGAMIDEAINMTISRTVITSGTTLLAALILYLYGGEGVRAFAYTLLIGIGVGTYSSIAVAAPLVWSKKSSEKERAAVQNRLSGYVSGSEHDSSSAH
ncbi:MAG: protein translocase subunit SecD [Phycisphaerales bacterium]|jgi:SecD/SecF fusion protein|nr:protein translocase subunit SecD [Phycisphaerales bacterium]